jgi:integrase/recombinase XerD
MIQEMQIRNYSERTIKTYVTLLQPCLRSIGKPLSQVTGEDLKDYIYYRIREDKISVSTVNQIISAWKIVCVHILGRAREDLRIIRPRREKRLPEILSLGEALSLIDSPYNLKHRAILNLVYSTGIRCNELLSLLIGDIDSKRMVIHIRQGKGKKDRQVVLHPKALELLRAYFRAYRPVNYLFEGRKRGLPYSATSLTNIVKENAKKIGIKKSVSPHTLRHCYATHMLEKGANLRVIQQLMGHNSLKTTSGYLALANIDNGSLPNPLD